MKKILFLFVSLCLAGAATAQTWTLDPSHSGLSFSIDHMVVSEVDGAFSKFTGTGTSAQNSFVGGQITVNVDVASINTNEAKRDEHLKSGDFFDVAKYPQITFTSTSIEGTGGNNLRVKGNLTMHGVTKPVQLEGTYRGTVQDPYGLTRSGFKLTGKINRKDYGLTWSKALETGGLVVADEVRLTITAEITKNK